MNHGVDNTGYRLLGARPHSADGLPRASVESEEATGSSTMKPNVGQSPFVDNEVVLRTRDRLLICFGSLDPTTELRLTTPGDFCLSTTISPAVLCDDLRRTRAPKNVPFRGIHRRQRDSSSNSSGKSADCSGREGSRNGSPQRRRYVGYRGSSPIDLTDTPAGAPWAEHHELDGHFAGARPATTPGHKLRYSPPYTSTGFANVVLQQLMPISCHFQYCKALLFCESSHVSSAISSIQTFTLTKPCQILHHQPLQLPVVS